MNASACKEYLRLIYFFKWEFKILIKFIRRWMFPFIACLVLLAFLAMIIRFWLWLEQPNVRCVEVGGRWNYQLETCEGAEMP